MQAGTLNCPMCGAAASTKATLCGHCGARLATVACPSCFGLMFLGEKFCSHCGTEARRTEIPDEKGDLCPRCQMDMESTAVGTMNLRECPRCAGLWLGVETMEKICADPERQTAVLGIPAILPEPETTPLETAIRYLPCSVCRKLMNRVHFASHSGVIVDVCRGHGTWFDRDELRRVVEFIRAGGLEKKRAEEMAVLETKRRTEPRRDLGTILSESPGMNRNLDWTDWGMAVYVCAKLASWLLRR